MIYSVIVPVYRNAEFVPLLVSEFGRIASVVAERSGTQIEVVFVVDGGADDSHELLREALPGARFSSQLVLHARNFGSFAAIRTGLRAAKGDIFATIAADLQEPPELLISFLETLAKGDYDVVVGVRDGHEEQGSSRLFASVFWRLYRRFVVGEIPPGGVDVFACNAAVRNELLRLEESHSSLIGLLFWLGFRRREIRYTRRARLMGRSAWTFTRKVSYLLDSIFAFTDLPVRILMFLGLAGVSIAACFGIIVFLLRLFGQIVIPGYAATVIVVVFFGALNTLGLGLVGSYAWRAYENTKRRPLAVVRESASFTGDIPDPPSGASADLPTAAGPT